MAALLLLAVVAYMFRVPLLRAAGNALIVQDELEAADAIVVLGGNPYDRATAGAQLFNEGWAPVMYCTGGSAAHNLDALDLDYTEAGVTRTRLLKLGVPGRKVIPLNEGTSTWEESELLLQLCKDEGYSTIIVLSDLFHTARIEWVFKERFQEEGIQVLIAGASSTRYNEQEWWENEYGLIMVNNEYIKKVYYWLKH